MAAAAVAGLVAAPVVLFGQPAPVVLLGQPETTPAADAPEPGADSDPVRILPLGASITYGYEYGSYRLPLWDRLVDDEGYTINFVGSRSDGPSELPDTDHEGHSGWRLDQIEDKAAGWVAQHDPDIVLLHAGTNDLIQGASPETAAARLDSLLDTLTTADPEMTVIVSTLIPLHDDPRIPETNELLTEVVAAHAEDGQRVMLADMAEGGPEAGEEIPDGVHPNAAGYEKMAEVWAPVVIEAIEQRREPGGDTVPEADQADHDEQPEQERAISAAADERRPSDRCRWYAAAIRLARSLADEDGPRADAIREELARYDITADSEPPPDCPDPAENADNDADQLDDENEGSHDETGGSGGQLTVDDRMFTRGGERFFWLGDTAWSLFINLDRDQVQRYLDTRAEQGFTVIQAVAIFPQAGGPGPNQYGDSPFGDGLGDLLATEGDDPGDEDAYDYWDHVDFVVEEAAARGLVMGILPVWADGQAGSLVTTGNAGAYGEFLGERYGDDPNIAWIMGGDSPADGVEDVWRELAAGIEAGGGDQPMTYHPRGDQTSIEWFADADWIDFHMIQGGHCLRYDVRDQLIADTYAAGKAFLDGEPIYEDHPYCWDNPPSGYSTALDVRRDAWWAVLGGAAGHTYGHHAVWQFLTDDRDPSLGARGAWTEALAFPGAQQMQYVRELITSRPPLEPADALLADPGSGAERNAAAIDDDATTLVAYSAGGRPITVDLSEMSASQLQPWWYSPRTGEAIELDTITSDGSHEFTPPETGGTDWVLVVDDAVADFAMPGGS